MGNNPNRHGQDDNDQTHLYEQFKRDAVALLEGGRKASQRARERALQERSSIAKGLLHHSERGCQLPHCVRPAGSLGLAVSASLRLTSAEFRRRLDLRGFTPSMSRRANCYDNATMESFWATLKAECFGSTIPLTRTQARSMVCDYIETFYNPVRLHSALGFQSPVAFEHSIQNN